MRRKDAIAFIMIRRTQGSDGTIGCELNTACDVNSVPGKRGAIENKDFVPIVNRKIVFLPGEVE